MHGYQLLRGVRNPLFRFQALEELYGLVPLSDEEISRCDQIDRDEETMKLLRAG